MATFFVTSDQVVLGTAAVGANDTYRGGVLVDAAAVKNKATTSAGAQFSNGLIRLNTGPVRYVDATAGLPADTQWCNGLPMTAAGQLCVSTDPASTYSNGIPFASNGAVAALVDPA